MLAKLDVKKMIKPILHNYNEHVVNLVHMLDEISCNLIYDKPFDVQCHLREKTVYACSVKYKQGHKIKLLKSIFPIMIGSELDRIIRKRHVREITSNLLVLDDNVDEGIFEEADIIPTSFIINGSSKQLPYFYTNDPTSIHVVRNSIVRCYSYDTDDRGKELSLYVDSVDATHLRGDLIVTLNDGLKTTDINQFFSHCPYSIDQVVYMLKVYDRGCFDIDHLANKIVISPGHLFVKLFVKYLYVPLRTGLWSAVKSKLAMVTKSIENGTLLHVLSRKTIYFKESGSTSKMVHMPRENHRELGENGEIYVEKNTGCYRDISMQTYPLNPYLAYLIVRQISNKVKKNADVTLHSSYIGYFCVLGTFETKNVGRTNMMVRDTYVSTCDDMESVIHAVPGKKLYEVLDLKPKSCSRFYVVVNEACIPVTEQSFLSIDLLKLKKIFPYIECYQEHNFIHIRLKMGIFLKRMENLWISPREEEYWADRLYGFKPDLTLLPKFRYEGPPANLSCFVLKLQLVAKFGYDFITGYHVDLNPFFMHNSFPKVIWAYNALKNAVLATTDKYSMYFMESFSTYTELTPYHKVVCEPVDSYSANFALYVPQVTVSYMSFQGNNQEDSIIVRDDLNVFNCHRFYTIRVKFELIEGDHAVVSFSPIQGDPYDEYLGTVVCHSTNAKCRLNVMTQSIHIKTVRVNDREVKLYFSKSGFKISKYVLNNDYLAICLKQFHMASTGDKLCSFHGQKGVMRRVTKMPLFDETVTPDLLINPYCLFRMTPGQIKEAVTLGEGKDARIIRNSDGRLIEGASVFYGKTFYFLVAYLSSEHIYTPVKCVLDKILGQAVKGRSRGGGMRIGNMELMNGMRGNGIAACYEEKFLEHGDRLLKRDGVLIPKAVELCCEDAKFFKCNISTTGTACIREAST